MLELVSEPDHETTFPAVAYRGFDISRETQQLASCQLVCLEFSRNVTQLSAEGIVCRGRNAAGLPDGFGEGREGGHDTNGAVQDGPDAV